VEALHPLRYAVAATLARSVVEAAAITFVLVGTERGVSGEQLGVLVACTAAPQVLTAPWLGARLDASRRPSATLATMAVVIGAGVALIGAGLGQAPILAVYAVAVVWSIAEPGIMGGLSGIASRSARPGGRLEAWDAVSYGGAAIVGQALVAIVTLVSTAAAVIVVLVVLAVLAALAITRLPLRPPVPATDAVQVDVSADRGPAVRAALRLMAADRELRSITVLTTISMSAFGGLALAAVGFARHTGRPAESASVLVLSLAIGALVGSLGVTRLASPPAPLRAATVAVAVVGVSFALSAIGPWWLAVAAFFVAGVADGPLLVSTFTMRTARTPDDLRASVYTTAASLKIAGTALGAVVVGLVADDDGGRAGMVVLAGGQALALVALAVTQLVGRRAAKMKE